MANLVAEGATGVGATVDVFTSSEFNIDKVADYDKAKGDLMKALGSVKLGAGKDWIKGEYVFWAGVLARACKENDPSVVAKVLG